MRNQKVWEPLSPSLSSSPPGWGQWSNRLVEEWVWILLQDVELYFMYHCLTNFQEITFLVVFSSKFTVITEKKPKHHHPMLRHQLVSHTLDKRADKTQWWWARAYNALFSVFSKLHHILELFYIMNYTTELHPVTKISCLTKSITYLKLQCNSREMNNCLLFQ